MGLPEEFFEAVRRPIFGGRIRQEQVDGLNYLVPSGADFGVSKPQLAYILATTYHETNQTMQPVREGYYVSEDPDAAEEWRRRNLARYYPYYGRGYVQLTWESNYRWAGDLLGLDLVGNPDLALAPENARPILFEGMMRGAFGLPLTQFVNEGRKDYVRARRSVNVMQAASLIATTARRFEAALEHVELAPTQPVPAPGVDPVVFELLQQAEDIHTEIRERLKGDRNEI